MAAGGMQRGPGVCRELRTGEASPVGAGLEFQGSCGKSWWKICCPCRPWRAAVGRAGMSC